MASTKNRRSKLLYWIGGITLVIILLAAFSNWIVKLLWLHNLGYQQVFWTIKDTQFLLFFGALIVALLYVIPNMYYLSKQIPYINLNLGGTPLGQLNLQRFSSRQIRIFLYIIGSIMSLFFSFAYYTQWNAFFRFSWHETFGKVDPIFGHDIGFYIFRLPFIETIQNSLILLVFFVTTFILVIYLINGTLSLRQLRNSSGNYPTNAVKHVSINIGLWFVLLGWSYFLERYHLLYNNNGVVFGAGYTDVHVVLPVLWVMTILSVIMGIIAFYQTYRMQVGWLLKGAGTMLAIGIIGQVILPPAIQSFSVKPNELKLEKPYLKYNIKQTRQAYGLNTFHEQNYNASDTLSFSKIQNNTQTINNIRLWDPRLIINTFRQLQEIRLYYSFPNVNLDRYHTD
ncbi:MAG TPA: UPF0182 family protein, partial [Balneolaceae bacterium]|nr:UPF0182 family protein [Balneolaceae bacterium]